MDLKHGRFRILSPENIFLLIFKEMFFLWEMYFIYGFQCFLMLICRCGKETIPIETCKENQGDSNLYDQTA